MPYTFKGSLCGSICDECWEPLSAVEVRLYRASKEPIIERAVASPHETFEILSDREVSEREKLLVGRGETDAAGRFSIELDESYEGGPFEVDVYCATVPRPRVGRGAEPLQFSVTTLQPSWRQTEGAFVAA